MTLTHLFIDHFYTFDLKRINPLLLYVALSTTMISIFDNLPIRTSSWLLDAQRITIELSMSVGLIPKQSTSELSAAEVKFLNRIPKTLATAIGWLNIEPTLLLMNCCTNCFAMYPLDGAPEVCKHQVASIPGGPPDFPDSKTDTKDGAVEDFEPDLSETTCLAPLSTFVRGKKIAIRKYAVQVLSDWIARLFSRPHIEDRLDESLSESRKPYDEEDTISDIHQ